MYKARNAYNEALEDYNNKELLPEMRKLIGKCFMYKNTYGGGKTWPLYIKVMGIDEKNLNLQCVEFQKTSLEIVEIKLREAITCRGQNQFTRNDGYYPISNAEYNKAKKSLKKFIIEKLEL